jgi:Uncharacterized conserved protein
MSNLSVPSEASSKAMNEGRKAIEDWMETGGTLANPFALHSLAAMSAASAVGIAVASQWAGTVMGLMQGAMGRTFAGFDPLDVPAGRPARPEKPAHPPASTAVVAKLKSDARAAAEAAVEPSAPVAPKAEPVTKAASVKVAKAPGEALAPEDFRRPAEIEKPAKPDDLKRIAGIGPKLEQVLNGLGVWTYAQIAGWTPEEIAWVDDYLQFRGRIGRDDWVAQAAALARGEVGEDAKTIGKSPR